MLDRGRNGIVNRARALRREMTLPEGLLWRELRSRPNQLKFRRQHPIGQVVVDFYCPSARLVVEVDGEADDRGRQPELDFERDEWLRGQGMRVLRIPARDVLGNLAEVVRLIVGEASG